MLRLEASVDLARTLFIVASKSGTTLEPNALMDYFLARGAAAAGSAAASHFIAITDPGSRLRKIAEQKGFGRTFLGLPNIGGRYSVLSPFGLVPLAALGRDVGAFLEDARDGAGVRSAERAGTQSGRRAWYHHRNAG